jgi:excisionase family DNA binding protein
MTSVARRHAAPRTVSLVREERPTAATPPRPAVANDIARSPAAAPASVGALAPVLTVDEVAALLRVERKTVYAAIQRTEIPGVRRIGSVIRISRDAVLDWLAKGQGLAARRGRDA